jgi:hypothetical protein
MSRGRTIAWTTANGRSYRYDAPPPVPEPADPHDQSLARGRHQQHHREGRSRAGDRDGHDADADITTGEDLSWGDLTRPRPAAGRPSHNASHNASHDTDRAQPAHRSITATWDDAPPF